MIIRLYTGENGQAFFEDLNVPAGESETIALKAGADMTFRSFPDGSFSDWHTAPRLQYVIVLGGQMEIGIGDGTKRVLDPGDSTLSSFLVKWRSESEMRPNGR